MNDKIQMLNKTGTLWILISLLEKEKNITSLMEEMEGIGFSTTNKAVEALKALDLVVEKKGYYGARLFTLTDKGRKAAEKILELKKIINEE